MWIAFLHIRYILRLEVKKMRVMRLLGSSVHVLIIYHGTAAAFCNVTTNRQFRLTIL
jgi:hypothetical protein